MSRNTLVLCSLVLIALGATLTPCFGAQFVYPDGTVPRNSARTQPNVVRFAFGSCNRPYANKSSIIFDKVAAQHPDFFAWLGDAAYTDIRVFPSVFVPDTNDTSVRQKFDNVKYDPPYARLRESVPAILGVWDDHDYGINDGDSSFVHKEQMRRVYLDFLDEADDSPRRTQAGGIYGAYKATADAVNARTGRPFTVKVILTDVRYAKTPNDILGDAQWQWLDAQLADDEPEVFFIASGIQVFPDDRIQEHWDTPSRERVYGLIRKYARRVVFLSGDVHFAELMRDECARASIGYVPHELTSSGLNLHSTLHWQPISLISVEVEPMMNSGVPDTFSTPRDRFIANSFSEGLNFGVVHVEFDAQDPRASRVSLQVYALNQDGKVLERNLTFADLTPGAVQRQQSDGADECAMQRGHPVVRWLTHFFSGVFALQTPSLKVLAFLITVFLIVPLTALSIVLCVFYEVIWKRCLSRYIKKKVRVQKLKRQ